jgi:hypothetical protein
LKAHYPSDANCQRINKPVYLKLSFEICGLEKVALNDPSPLTFTFNMGIDDPKELSLNDLRSYFRSNSRFCSITNNFRITTRSDGSDFPLSPNLAKRFSVGASSIKLLNNFIGENQETKLFIKGVSSGDQGAYKPLNIKYIKNRSPQIKGDIAMRTITVR